MGVETDLQVIVGRGSHFQVAGFESRGGQGSRGGFGRGGRGGPVEIGVFVSSSVDQV